MIQIPPIFGIPIMAILFIAYIVVTANERHLPKWVVRFVTVLGLAVCLNAVLAFGGKLYRKTHEVPATATVWFPDVPARDLGESTARLAIITGSERAVTVICPKWFDPDTGRTYTADNFKLETGDGRFTPLAWELHTIDTTR